MAGNGCIANLRKDFIAVYLRSQMNRLEDLLNNIREGGVFDLAYADESLSEVTNNLKRLRQNIQEN